MNATKTAPAKKTAAKHPNTIKSLTPLLDAAKAVNPHKPEWNKEAATALLTELNTNLAWPDLTPDQCIAWLGQYGPLAGWKEVAKAIVKASAAR